MNISIIGTGYVGLCSAVGFAYYKNNVICVDIDKAKVDNIKLKIPPIYEDHMENFLNDAVDGNLLDATTDLNYAIKSTEIIIIAVGTPSSDDGSIDLNYIRMCSENVGRVMKDLSNYKLIVIKSTVLPETTENVIIPILEKFSGKKCGVNFGVCMNPEFLREGRAIEDFIHPDRIVIGEFDSKSGDILESLYKPFDSIILRTKIKTAEMIKYASNAFLATKISYINEIGNICKILNINVYDVAKGMGLDSRISPHFLNAGRGFGGSCFGKDVSAIIKKSEELNYNPLLIKSALSVNKNQPLILLEILRKRVGSLENKKVSVLGLAFKNGTDDIRDSSAIPIIKELVDLGCSVSAYDPKAVANMKKVFPKIEYCSNIQETLKGADACLVLTEWDEFKNLTNKDFSDMNKRIIIEGMKILDKNKVSDFEGICW